MEGLHFPQLGQGLFIALHVLQHAQLALVDQNSVYFFIVEGVHQLSGAGVGFSGQHGVVLLIQLLDGSQGIGLVVGQSAEGFGEQVLHLPVIVSPDIDGHQGGLILFGGDVVQGFHAQVDVADAHGKHQA